MPKKSEKSHDSLLQGLVISYYGSTVLVEIDAGQVIACHLRRNQELPVVGDEVSLQLEANGETGIVTGISPRRTVLARADVRSGAKIRKPIAANIDVLVVVMAPPPIFSTHLVDRYLVAAELLKLNVILVINKADLMNADSKAQLEADLKIYQNVPYPVVLTSTFVENGVAPLAALLQGKRGALVGPSGVGKSSLIAALGINEDIRVGDVSPKGAGKHTTTATRLYHLTSGGALIDSPGVREFHLWPISKAEVLIGFKEFAINEACRFRDCTHAVEPGCAVQTAVSDGRISPVRFKSYQELLETAIKPEDQYKS